MRNIIPKPPQIAKIISSFGSSPAKSKKIIVKYKLIVTMTYFAGFFINGLSKYETVNKQQKFKGNRIKFSKELASSS